MRVGGLGVIHVVHPGHPGDQRDPVGLRPERAQPGTDRGSWCPVGPGEGGGPERVRDVVRYLRPRHVCQFRQRHRLGAGTESPVNQRPASRPELAWARLAERDHHHPFGSAIPDGRRGQPRRPLVVGIADRDRPACEDLGFVGRVGLEAAMPVQVVRGDIEQRRGLRSDRRGPVQLEARQLDRDHFVGLWLGHHVDQRGADVSPGDAAIAGRRQYLGEHPNRGRLTVRARHREPRLPVAVGT